MSTKEMMKKEITLGQMIGFSITILTIVFSSYLNIKSDLEGIKNQWKINELRMTAAEARVSATENSIKHNEEKVVLKLEKIVDLVTEIRIQQEKNKK